MTELPRKIILPYCSEVWFTLEDQSLLRELNLTEEMVIDQLLSTWVTYTTGSAFDAYERTIDDFHTHYCEMFEETRDAVSFERLEKALAEHADELTGLLDRVAHHLHQVIADLPIDFMRYGINQDAYYQLRVESINRPGGFLELYVDNLAD